MSSIKESIQGLISTAAEGMASLTNSYVFTGASIRNPGKKTTPNNVNAEVYYEFLRPYHFVESTLSIFTSTVHEAIDKTDFRITVKDNSNSEASNILTSFLKDIGIKRYLIDNIDDMIWKGVHGVAVNLKKNTLNSIISPESAKMVTKEGAVVGYLYNNEYISSRDMITYYYKSEESKPIKDMKNLKMINKNYDKNKLKNYIVDYSTFEGYGLFKSQLAKIFQMYAIEYALYYLTLRDISRPELLGMSTGGRQVNAVQAVNSCNEMESLLNKPTLGLSNLSDPMAFMNTLSFNILNYIKILPSVEQYQSISELNYNELSQRIDKLQNKYDSDKKDVLSNLTIPEELYSGSSNRWEMISRNDRLMTTCDNLLKSFSRFVKDLCVAKAKQLKLPITYDDLKFNLEFASMLTSYDVKNKLQAVTDRMSDLDRLIGNVKSLLSNDFIDREGLYEYLKTQLNFADEKLLSVLKDEIPDNKSSSDDERWS